MRRILVGVVAGTLALGGLAQAQDYGGTKQATPGERTDTLSARDRQFLLKAANAGMVEVKLSKLALDRATAPEVKDFARQMIDDHSKTNDELKQIANRNGVDLPTAIDSEHQLTYDRLSKLQGAEFDREYMRVMKKDHDQVVADFKRESTEAQDPGLRTFVQKTLPTLQAHGNLIHKDMQKM